MLSVSDMQELSLQPDGKKLTAYNFGESRDRQGISATHTVEKLRRGVDIMTPE
jgi:hypothetical protein